MAKVFMLDNTFEVKNAFGISREQHFLRSALESIDSSLEPILPLGFRQDSSILVKVISFLGIRILNSIGKDKGVKLEPGSIFLQPQLIPVKPIGQHMLWIVRVHDLFPIEHPEWFKKNSCYQFQRGFDLANEFGAYFIANSEYTRSCLIRQGVTESRIYLQPCFVTRPSSNPCYSCKVCKSGVPLNDYALAIGTIEPRKNYRGLSNEWTKQRLAEFDLIIVGNHGWKQSRYGLSSQKVKLYGKVCDAGLNQLYSSAKIFVSASLDEGFDIPYHEARSYGLPLLVSNIPVHGCYPEESFAFDPLTFNGFEEALKNSLACEKFDQSYLNEEKQIQSYAETILGIIEEAGSIN